MEPGDDLIVSDALSVLQALERAWRTGRWTGSNRKNAAMIEAACAIRSAMKKRFICECVHMWCPGHASHSLQLHG